MLTPRQQQCLDAIRAHLTTHGHSPSYDELASVLGLSGKGAIVRLLGKLRDRGFVTWRPNCARSLRLTGKTVANDVAGLPMVALTKDTAAEIDAIGSSRNLSREAVVQWLLECALWSWTHGSLPPIEARHAAPFEAKAGAA